MSDPQINQPPEAATSIPSPSGPICPSPVPRPSPPVAPRPFRPSARQRRLAEAACSLAFSVQPRLVCAQAQIPHSTYYRWQKNPAFSAWLAVTVLQCLAANSPFLLLNTLQAALTGDASARKLIFQFCILPRLAPAMAALPAPGIEALLGLPNDAAPMLGSSPVPRPQSLAPAERQ